jgi:hypothetical protein
MVAKQIDKRPLTTSVAPKFHETKRPISPPLQPRQDFAKKVFKARPMPNFSAQEPFQQKRSVSSMQQSPTIPQPFRLSEGKKRAVKMDVQTKTFRAKPAPKSTYAAPATPVVEPYTPKNSGVEPFKLQTDERSERYQSLLKARREVEEEDLRRQQFKARPYIAPPPPKPRPLTPKTVVSPKPNDIVLSLEQRYQQSQEEMRRKILEEEEEIRRMAIFKANPLPPSSTYDPNPLSPTAIFMQKKAEQMEKAAAKEALLRKQSEYKANPLPKSIYQRSPTKATEKPSS